MAFVGVWCACVLSCVVWRFWGLCGVCVGVGYALPYWRKVGKMGELLPPSVSKKTFREVGLWARGKGEWASVLRKGVIGRLHKYARGEGLGVDNGGAIVV